MREYKAPLEDFIRILNTFELKDEVYDIETMKDILSSSAAWVEREMVPSNEVGDREGLSHHPDDYSVKVPAIFHEVYQGMVENGIYGLGLPEKWGGGGAPDILVNMMMEMLASGNLSLSTCPLLTYGAIHTIDSMASEDLKNHFLPKMVSGQWSGTMCLTEPQCGTDLGLIQTRATVDGDAYRITGNKIWITFGEHTLTENIVHLVLARLPDAPAGVKGISLFLVPKRLENGELNKGVFCTGLEKKMGSHGSPTCFMSYENAKGYLVGEPHQGLRAMFTMMNPARLAVGVQGLAMAEIAYQQALKFARERRQSRAINPQKRDQSQAADPIYVHPDVRRMLLYIRSQLIPLRLLVAYAGYTHSNGNEVLLGHLTPLIKSFCTERACLMVSEALQIQGGLGYTRDGVIEQYLRDVRITMIYEGTNGIQALDLVGRKIMKDAGKSIRGIVSELRGAGASEDLQKVLNESADLLEKALIFMAQEGMKNPELALSGASDFLRLLGFVMCGLMWAKIENNVNEDERLALRFYMDYIHPESRLCYDRLAKNGWGSQL